MMTLLLGLALAGPAVTDELVQVVVDEIYGKPVPAEAICTARPTVADLGSDLVVVGVKRGSRGCTLLGVMVDGSYASAETASKKAFSDERWTPADGAQRTRWLQAWSTAVLHAFDQFDLDDPRPVTKAADRGWVVSTTTWQRTERRLIANHVRERFVYTADRGLAKREAEVFESSKVVFTTNEIRLGSLPAEPIHQALKQQGRTIARCVEQAWDADVRVSGRTRLQWTLGGGRATSVAIVAADDDGSGLPECYARAVAKVDFPPNLSGTVVWAFNLAQKPAE